MTTLQKLLPDAPKLEKENTQEARRDVICWLSALSEAEVDRPPVKAELRGTSPFSPLHSASLSLQTVKGGFSETRIEKRIIITGDEDVDQDQVQG